MVVEEVAIEVELRWSPLRLRVDLEDVDPVVRDDRALSVVEPRATMSLGKFVLDLLAEDLVRDLLR